MASRSRPVGGRLRPCTASELGAISEAAFGILQRTGMSGLPSDLVSPLTELGARFRDDGRVCFSRTMVEAALERAPRVVDLAGFTEEHDFQVGGKGVHIGTGGAAVQVLDAKTGAYRDSALADLYAMMRVLDAAPNIDYGIRPLIARDMKTPFELDVNTAFACIKGTSKPIGISFSDPSHVVPIVQMLDTALGGEDRHRSRPFCMAVVVHAVPPLAFAAEGVGVLAQAVRAGMVPQICSAGQAGATSPVTLAGALAQGLAECLAGLVLVDFFKPGAPCIYALMPFISDLRTGAMAGGGGEGAIANAAAAQLLAHVGLPSTVSAGMTDAKVADAQAGYEKGYTVAQAALAGADMINLSAGMLGSIMVASPEALMIDNDMCGAILRSTAGFEVSSTTLDLDEIERVVTGDGHYLGEPSTLARMKSDYVYPTLGDRKSVDDWLSDGGRSIWDRACAATEEILRADPPQHLPRAAEAEIRAHFPIRLPEGDP